MKWLERLLEAWAAWTRRRKDFWHAFAILGLLAVLYSTYVPARAPAATPPSSPGEATQPQPSCARGPVVDGLPVIYCPEKWDVNPYVLRRPFFETPMLRPDFRERVLVRPPKMLYRPKRDVTE